MECSCVRQTDIPGTSRLFADLIYQFDRVSDLYPHRPNDGEALAAAAQFDFPADRRAALVRALTPLNQGNPSLEVLARAGNCGGCDRPAGRVVFRARLYGVQGAHGDQSGAGTDARGIPAVPVFWLATEDHDFAEVDHVWVFGADYQPVKIRVAEPAGNGSHPVGGIPLEDVPIGELRAALAGLPFADEAVAMVERAYAPGATMGSAFAGMVKELFGAYGLLLIDPMERSIRELAAPLMKQAVERMPELVDALMARSRN